MMRERVSVMLPISIVIDIVGKSKPLLGAGHLTAFAS
jgi:hypothetical protein